MYNCEWLLFFFSKITWKYYICYNINNTINSNSNKYSTNKHLQGVPSYINYTNYTNIILFIHVYWRIHLAAVF